jgi:hypothetical protein
MVSIPTSALDANGRVLLYRSDGGEPIRRWPVDAREMLEQCGDAYSLERPASVPAPAPLSLQPAGAEGDDVPEGDADDSADPDI